MLSDPNRHVATSSRSSGRSASTSQLRRLPRVSSAHRTPPSATPWPIATFAWRRSRGSIPTRVCIPPSISTFAPSAPIFPPISVIAAASIALCEPGAARADRLITPNALCALAIAITIVFARRAVSDATASPNPRSRTAFAVHAPKPPGTPLVKKTLCSSGGRVLNIASTGSRVGPAIRPATGAVDADAALSAHSIPR